MRYDAGSDQYILSTGTRFYAHNGILGLSSKQEEEELPDPCRCDELSYGYDGGFTHSRDEPCFFNEAERREIAEAMVTRWLEWATHPAGTGGSA